MVTGGVRCALLLAVAAGPVTARLAAQGPDDALVRRANQVAALIRAEPAGFDTLFAPAFLAQVPPARLVPILAQIHRDGGVVTRVTLVERTGPTGGRFDFVTERGLAVPVRLTVEAEPPARVAGLFFSPPVRLAPDFPTLVQELRALPGTVSFQAARLEGDRVVPLAELNPDTALAIGSAFKLYALGTLVDEIRRGRRAWADVVRLDSAAKSVPSGALRDWPAGTALTLQTLATLMISQSDNTATDQLIRTLGRERVERHQAAMGHAAPGRNVPFPTTREITRLKTDTALGSRYLAADAGGRRALLAKAATGPVDASALAGGRPARIESLEWFASAADLVRAMRWLRDATAAGAAAAGRGVLAVNPGLPQPAGTWAYQGFKGGSESGVLNLTFLLAAPDGTWYAVAASWNDPAAPVDQNRLLGLVGRALQLLRS